MNSGERVNILVVDDNAENRLSLEAILSESGQHVVTAASGRDALRRLLEQEFAVILLDVKMPVMDGFETAALVRQRKSSERTPIIFITAFSDDIHVARGYSLGAVDYIVAPVVPEVLRSKVAVFVELFRKTEQIRHQAESLRRRADQLYHLTEASLAINSVNSLGEILEIVTETARDLLAPRCALTTTTLDQAQRPQRLNLLEIVAEDGARECDHQRFTAQAAAMTAALADHGRTVLVTAREVVGDPRWRFLADGDGGAESDAGRVGNGAAEFGWLAAPLTGRDGRCFGWVHLAGRAREEIGQFGDEDKTILTQLAQVASIAIENCLSSEAREANRLKDEFLTTLSHELRTPLTAILGWTRVLRTSPFDAGRCAHGLEVIERNVTAQTKLIEDLLDVSRIIAGKLRVNLRPIPLLPSIESAVEAMRPAAEAKGMTLTLEIAPDVDHRAAIAGDADRLQQVGWNLISNAIKFTPQGGRIVVAFARSAAGFQVRVTDTGKGISPQFLVHVFDRFRQDDSSSTRAHGGLGIGLAIVRHIVELHGGRVDAESPGVNCGATFTVTLPELAAAFEGLGIPPIAGDEEQAATPAPPAAMATMAAMATPAEGTTLMSPATQPEALVAAPASAGPAATAATAATATAAVAAVDLGRLKIVVVDDEPDTREILSEILQAAGATVATAASLADALALCDHFRPDLLISDIAMPGGDGYALVRQLRRRGPRRGGGVPAIAVSAHAREEDRRRALAAGFLRYVTKPVEPADLLRAVREIAAGLPVASAAEAGAAREAREDAAAAGPAPAGAVGAGAGEAAGAGAGEDASAGAGAGAAAAAHGGRGNGRQPRGAATGRAAAGGGGDLARGARGGRGRQAGAGGATGEAGAGGEAGATGEAAAETEGAEGAGGRRAHGAGDAGRAGAGDVDVGESTSDAEAAAGGDADAGARRILLVEDDADTREALKTLLELSGHQVAVAADGGEAVAHVVAYRPDVALVDIGLPEIDGNEVARRIRALLGAGGIFLVALTGYGGEAEEELARAAGFDAHFTKPVELSRLDRLLRTRGRASQQAP
jgi:CheY-like chemotaxis protein